MKYKDRIDELEKEILQFDYERLKRLEQLQQFQSKLQYELADINEAVLTRKGEIIGLKRLISEKEQKENGISTSKNM